MLALVLLLVLGCAPESEHAEPPPNLTKGHVCESFLETAGTATTAGTTQTGEVRGDDALPRSTTAPSSAEQFRHTARQLAEFAASARDADDPELAERAARLETQARSVLRNLPSEASDEEAQRITRPMFTESTALYYDCAAHLVGPIELPTEITSGACAEPDAPTLHGPHVVYYGSTGYEFVESSCKLVQGTPTDDGCSFPGGMATSGDAGDDAFAIVEVAYDPDTCRALHETGRIAADGRP